MNRYLIVIVATAALVGCATDPIATSDTQAIPADRVLTTDYRDQRPDTGLIVVKRDPGYLGSKCKLRLSIDAKPTAEILPAERVELYVPAGEHILSVDTNGRCDGGLAEVTSQVKAGAKSTFRISFSESGEFHISPTAF